MAGAPQLTLPMLSLLLHVTVMRRRFCVVFLGKHKRTMRTRRRHRGMNRRELDGEAMLDRPLPE
jgi:hypothetical protein